MKLGPPSLFRKCGLRPGTYRTRQTCQQRAYTPSVLRWRAAQVGEERIGVSGFLFQRGRKWLARSCSRGWGVGGQGYSLSPFCPCSPRHGLCRQSSAAETQTAKYDKLQTCFCWAVSRSRACQVQQDATREKKRNEISDFRSVFIRYYCMRVCLVSENKNREPGIVSIYESRCYFML